MENSAQTVFSLPRICTYLVLLWSWFWLRFAMVPRENTMGMMVLKIGYIRELKNEHHVISIAVIVFLRVYRVCK